MRLFALLLFSVVILSACQRITETKTNETSEINPFEYCSSIELAEDSAAYYECVSDKICDICLERNLKPSTDEYIRCEKDLRNAAFVRQQMQIRGF